MKISSFDWDEGNLFKLQKHNVPMAAIENFFTTTDFKIVSDEKHFMVEPRFIAFGKYLERQLYIVFTFRSFQGILKIRVISARYASKKELRKLNEDSKKEKNNKG